jgi:hypothetical protein
MTTKKTKAPAKKSSPSAKPKVVVAAKVPASAKKVKAPPSSLKKAIPARKPVPAKPPKLTVVAPAPAKKTAAKPTQRKTTPATPDNKVRIFQIYYRPDQRQYLDPAFEPYNNQGDNSPLLEFNVFRKLVNSDLTKGSELWGALSWKFKEKTGLTGEQLRQIIANNPGHDAYYCNPFPELEGMYHNLWLQGETSHPNFLILCRDFFQATGLDENIFLQLVPSQSFAASNYFVATPKFWSGYMDFMDEVITKAERGMSSTAKAMIYSAAADRKGMHAGASYMPFIVERLFGVYLAKTQGQYRTFKFPSEQAEAKLNVHLKLLRQMRDVAISSKSLWMASCWVNYRNLYMQQFHGKDWCNRYLRDITPSNIAIG